MYSRILISLVGLALAFTAMGQEELPNLKYHQPPAPGVVSESEKESEPSSEKADPRVKQLGDWLRDSVDRSKRGVLGREPSPAQRRSLEALQETAGDVEIRFRDRWLTPMSVKGELLERVQGSFKGEADEATARTFLDSYAPAVQAGESKPRTHFGGGSGG